MIAVIDYDAGNIQSVIKAVKYLGANVILTDKEDEILAADKIILPGVGAFPAAMASLKEKGLVPVIKRAAKEKPFLGICLGMQILFDRGFEFEETEGLSLIPGEVRPIDAKGLKIPHMGWNSLEIRKDCAVTERIKNGDFVYFVHSFAAKTDAKYIASVTDYGGEIVASVCNGNVFGTQFHPEKSGETGLDILRGFLGKETTL